MDCSLPGPSVHGIFQARVLEWVTIAFSQLDMTERLSTAQGTEAEIHRKTQTDRDQGKDVVRDSVLQTEKGVQDSGQKELQRREDHQRSGRQSWERAGSGGVLETN